MAATEGQDAESKPHVIYMAFHDGSGNPDDDPDHERGANERYYDEVIAPELARLGKLCTDRGMSMVAKVEIERSQGMTGSTRAIAEGMPGFKLHAVYMADKCEGNVDTLIRGLLHVAERDGGLEQSIYLTMLKRALDRKD